MARRRSLCARRECSLHEARAPHPQLYTTEPGKRNGKTLTPPDSKLNTSAFTSKQYHVGRQKYFIIGAQRESVKFTIAICTTVSLVDPFFRRGRTLKIIIVYR